MYLSLDFHQLLPGHTGWLPEPLAAYLRENFSLAKWKKKSLISDDKKYEFHVCITTFQIIQFTDDQGQDKSSLLLNKQTCYISDMWDFLKAAWQWNISCYIGLSWIITALLKLQGTQSSQTTLMHINNNVFHLFYLQISSK